ncbi:MAG TPA: molybdopterin-dependent oxidoreductase [Chryseolinea sp.]|nr:molybdopterin-dependent oxidoreductase [Chryseolinea sp.]
MDKARIISRRQALIAGLAGMGGLLLPGCTRPLPPNYGSVLRMGDNLTYVAQRTLLPGQSLAKEYKFSDISSMPATGTTNPAQINEAYDKLLKKSFAGWQLSIEGSVARAGSLSLSDLKKFPARTQITKHHCEEGWTAIAEWTGVPLSSVLQHAGIQDTARFINFHSYDGWIDSIDLYDAFHPQTILAYGMNGKDLSVPHGAPVRLRVEKQIGYKSMKYIHKIEVTNEFVAFGDSGWAWYTGI